MAKKSRRPADPETTFLFEESLNLLGEVLIPFILIPVGLLLVGVSGGERPALLLTGVLLTFLSLCYTIFILRSHVRVHHASKTRPGPPKEYALFMAVSFLLLAVALALGGMAQAFQGFVATLAAMVLVLLLYEGSRSASRA